LHLDIHLQYSHTLSDNLGIIVSKLPLRVKRNLMSTWKIPTQDLQPTKKVKGLVQDLFNILAKAIQLGEIKEGEKLPTEAEIMAKYDVSRTVVREALSKLQASSLVETRHGIGTFSLPSSESSNFKIIEGQLSTINDVIFVLELRLSIETEAAGLAAQRRLNIHLAAMDQALLDFSNAIEKNSDAVPLDFNFHMEVARATGNQHFADLMTYLGTMSIPRSRVNTPNTAPEGRLNYLKRVHAEHKTIYEAIKNKNAEDARAAMRSHLSNSTERLRKSQDDNNLLKK